MDKSDPLWLRQRTRSLRGMTLDGDDLHLRAALLELADDFDLEAATIEGQLGNRSLCAASKLPAL
jgi:hypothetical protein